MNNTSSRSLTAILSTSLVATFAILVAATLFTAESARAGAVLFDDSTDTISIDGGTTLGSAATYEARFLLTAASSGIIFNEWASGLEDKLLGVSSSSVGAFSYWVGDLFGFNVPVTVTLNEWHHLAYVYDGSEERLYLDGVALGSRPTPGTMRNSFGLPFLGAAPRGSSVAPSFIGYLDTFRVSDIARYSGGSFAAPQGDLTSDANTQLLFNFNEAAGSTTVADLSPNGYTGTLGTGFAGATSPVLIPEVPEPSSALLLLGSGWIGLLGRHRRRASESSALAGARTRSRTRRKGETGSREGF